MVRSLWTHKYSWSIPNQEAIEVLVSHSPLIEIGAGNGYWASLIRQLGGDVLAFDISPYENGYVQGKWGSVLKGDYITIPEYPNRTLFMCWPPDNDGMAHECLSAYTGDTFILVGETARCGNHEFYDLLESEWEITQQVNIPSYYWIKDFLLVFSRK